ncbi:MAG TPA: D-alanyl-D-alanine carboxypeptidase family protein [Thermoanaerobaculia bacterium]|nr:D-alanyl-D-alanine carboxypeptidase family protein [Thermoanaerobaculia bacterium]
MKRLGVFLLLLLPFSALAQNPEDVASGPTATQPQGGKGYTAAYVIEPTTRRVLFAENEHVPMPTASMAKMMTLLIAMEEIRDNRLKLTDPVKISPRASKMGGSQIFAKDGQIFPVQTLIAATMVHSANDAAQALAEKIAGSSEAFADLMNQRAQELKLTHSRFVDPHGLPPSTPGGPQNVMCAHDLAVLGLENMKHPLLRQYAAMPSMPFVNGTFTSGMTNPNRLLRFYDGATGIKTGYSVPAGFCVTASAQRGGMELVAVVMGAKTSRGPLSSFEIAARLMNTAFVNYRMVTAVKKGATVGQAAVTEGKVKTVPAVASTDAKALVKRGEESTVKVAFAGGAVQAPVRAGQPVGSVVVQMGNQVLARGPAVAGAAVPKQPWWMKFWPF